MLLLQSNGVKKCYQQLPCSGKLCAVMSESIFNHTGKLCSEIIYSNQFHSGKLCSETLVNYALK